MPGALEYILDQRGTEYRALEDAHAKEYKARAARFQRHWDCYDGIMAKPLVVEQDGVDDNVILCKTDQVADKLVSFLLGDNLRFDAGGDDDASPEDEAIKQLWRQSSGQMLLHKIALSGALEGHCAVRLEPRQGMMPRLVGLNQSHFSAFWDLDDIDRVLWYRLQYRINEGGPGKRIDYVRGRLENNRVVPEGDAWYEFVYRNKGLDARWEQDGPPVLWPYLWPPIVDWQNMPRPHAYYGADDVQRAVALNHTVNLVASSYNRILKHHAHPKTVGLGFDAGEVVGTSIGGFWTVNKSKSEADIFNLEMQSDLASSREFLNIILREIWQSARMVDPQSIKDAIGTLTNFGLKVLYADAISKIGTKQALYGEGFERIGKRGLELAGMAPPEAIKVLWPDVLPEDTAEIMNGLLKEREAGAISMRTYRGIRGYDHELEEERLAEERQGEDTLGARLLSAFERGQ